MFPLRAARPFVIILLIVLANGISATPLPSERRSLLDFLNIVPLLTPLLGGTNFTCAMIDWATSSATKVSYSGPIYDQDNLHYSLTSSANSTCSVEPATAADVATIIKIIGTTRVPFAVKGGGHATNPGFSSTTGVQISMAKFNETKYDAASQTVTVGPGLIWDQVYAALAPLNISVVGGRLSTVGVAGFSLGGGYSWLSNQYGLTVDNTVAYELVLPSGKVTNVTEASNPDLFFALRGGGNNFGIVTKFTFKAHAQGPVWGGTIIYDGSHLDELDAAIANFSNNNKDPKAGLFATYGSQSGLPFHTQLLFYDGPTQPGVFDDFLAIPSVIQDVQTRNLAQVVAAMPGNLFAGSRIYYHTVSLLAYSPTLLRAIRNETEFWGQKLLPESAVFINYDQEPFDSSFLSHGSSPTAYPPDRSRPWLPQNIFFAWTDPSKDAVFKDAIITTANTIKALAIAEGQDIADAPIYGNYAVFGTPLESIYGANVPRLKNIKASVDPSKVMDLAGGWKF